MRRISQLFHRRSTPPAKTPVRPRDGVAETVCVTKPQRTRSINEGAHKLYR